MAVPRPSGRGGGTWEGVKRGEGCESASLLCVLEADSAWLAREARHDRTKDAPAARGDLDLVVALPRSSDQLPIGVRQVVLRHTAFRISAHSF